MTYSNSKIIRIGSDLVDVTHIDDTTTSINFDKKVFSPDEFSTIHESNSPGMIRWLFWAAKEAAFKAAVKVDNKARFLPSAYKVSIDVFNLNSLSKSQWLSCKHSIAGNGHVGCEVGIFYLNYQITNKYI